MKIIRGNEKAPYYGALSVFEWIVSVPLANCPFGDGLAILDDQYPISTGGE
jgi:hypothetical protein